VHVEVIGLLLSVDDCGEGCADFLHGLSLNFVRRCRRTTLSRARAGSPWENTEAMKNLDAIHGK
jgi:hypothetical protein